MASSSAVLGGGNERLRSVMVGIDYRENIDKAIAVISQALRDIQEVETEPQPDILVKELAASTVNLEVRFWVDSHRAGFLATTSKVAQAVKESLEAANIEMPTDIYTLVVRELPSPVTTHKLN